jgi:hypothetical protein
LTKEADWSVGRLRSISKNLHSSRVAGGASTNEFLSTATSDTTRFSLQVRYGFINQQYGPFGFKCLLGQNVEVSAFKLPQEIRRGKRRFKRLVSTTAGCRAHTIHRSRQKAAE